MRKFLLFIALIISGVGLNAQSVGDNTIIDYEGYSLKFTVTHVTNAECEVVCSTKPTESMNIDIPSKVTINGKEYSVTSIGSSAFVSNKIISVTIPNSVTSIGSFAFSSCTALTSITIPNSVTSIGISAFKDCTALTSITIPNSVTSIGNVAFGRCSKLTSITFEEDSKLKTVKGFRECTALTSITIPNSVTTIGDDAFYSCSKLTNITIPNSVTTIGDNAFYSCSKLTSITIPNSVTYIGKYAFSFCSKLTSITIPKNVEIIYDYVFQNCEELVEVKFEEGSKLEKLGYGAFSDCSRLTTIQLPDGLKEIGLITFGDCTSLESIIIPNTVEKLGNSALSGCTELKSVTLSNKLTEISSSLFSGCELLNNIIIPERVSVIDNYAFKGCASLTSIIIPNKVEEVRDYAFDGCTELTSVTLSNKLTKISKYLFIDCKKLDNIIIPNSVTTIDTYAFKGCTSLTSIIIPNSVTSIEDYAFSGCKNLSSLSFESNSELTSLDGFDGCVSLTDVTIPNSVTSVEVGAFDGTSITSITIPKNVLFVSGFAGCKKLTNVIFEEGSKLKSIGNNAFENCILLTSITVPKTVTGIWNSSFEGCNKLESVIFEEGSKLENIGSSGTNASGYGRTFYGCTSLKHIVIPESVSVIGRESFYNCSSLASINIPKNITEIYPYAFRSCSSLVNIDIPHKVTKIGEYAFAYCSALKKVVLPSTVTNIGQYAFSSCSSIENIRICAETPPTTSSNVFYLLDNIMSSINLEVPEAGLEAYKSKTPWKNFNITSFPGVGSSITINYGSYALDFVVTSIEPMECEVLCSTKPTTATSNNTYNGAVSGSGNYTDGTTATVKATASDDSSFISWTENGVVVSNDAQYSFVVDKDRNLVANFSSSNHWVADMNNYPNRMTVVGQIYIDDVEQEVTTFEIGAFCGQELRGSAKAKYISNVDKYLVQFEIGGSANDEISFKLYNHQTGTEVALIAPDEIDFIANGNLGDVNNPYTFNFVSKVNIVATVNPSEIGTITGTGIYTIGDEVTLTATSTSNEYLFVSWTENGVVVSINETYTFVADRNRNLVANYSINNYWDVDDSPFNNNMTIIAVLQIDDVEQNTSNYEVGAFCEGELRGSERLKFEEDMDKYLIYLTIYGETNDLISFKLYDHSTQSVSDLTHLEKINFEINGTVGDLMDPYVFNFLSGVYITASCNPSGAGKISGIGKYPLEATATLKATANDGFKFKNWTLNGEVVSTETTYSMVVEQATELVANFNYIHERELREGWNWYSTYIDVSGSEGLNMMQDGLNESAVQIKGQNNFVNYQNGIWYGLLNSISSEQMYMIQTSEVTDLAMIGELVNPSESPIQLGINWRWISYPVNQAMNLVTALSEFIPDDGDYIKSQNNGFAQYYESLGWRGTLNSLTPGQGYMYQNTSGETKTLTFSVNNSKEDVKANITSDNNHWIPNTTKYPSNISIIAVVENNTYTSGDYEIGAFNNGECRGSARPIYIEELDKHIIFLTVYGENNETITFRYYDVENESECQLTNSIVFTPDATIGDMKDNYVLNFAPTSINELSGEEICVYPNPANRDTKIYLGTSCDIIEIYNSVGVKVSEYRNVNCIDGISTSGVYMLKTVNNGVTTFDKIVIR